ncbi:MAG: response regulator transcription factor [Acidimicrobiia bacterium]|nr:response regulator transcription factor [Acidimicrobiia bacterium]
MASIGMPIRVELVDPHCLFRAGLRALIERWEGIEVVGETGEESEAAALVQNARPHHAGPPDFW